ncbi:hypothetical protein TrLO_g2990 [Triparma laevis f. longispina]|uniref:Uncharacterized protein n=1 Tax=Triparma laevis f. longispina TaxID=1714387 RepID=A0A9W7A3Q1_9STRA|nr:hypothetical protein TrLO_g2990 [Triparma laevis f. longispina]
MSPNNNNTNARSSSEKEKSTKRVGLACIEPFVIDTKNTLGANLFGPKGARILWRLFRPPYLYVTAIMFFVSMIVSCLAFVEVIDKHVWSWTILCAIPAWCGMYSMLNVELTKQISTNFDALLILGYSTVGGFSMAISLNDARFVVALFGWVGFINIVFFDAAPERVRASSAMVAVYFVMLFLIAVNAAIWFKKFPNLTLHHITIGETTYSSESITFICFCNCIIYYLHMIFNMALNPSKYTLLRSAMSVKVEEKSAEILTTVQKRLSVSKERTSGGRTALKPFKRSTVNETSASSTSKKFEKSTA